MKRKIELILLDKFPSNKSNMKLKNYDVNVLFKFDLKKKTLSNPFFIILSSWPTPSNAQTKFSLINFRWILIIFHFLPSFNTQLLSKGCLSSCIKFEYIFIGFWTIYSPITIRNDDHGNNFYLYIFRLFVLLKWVFTHMWHSCRQNKNNVKHICDDDDRHNVDECYVQILEHYFPDITVIEVIAVSPKGFYSNDFGVDRMNLGWKYKKM